MIPNPFLNATTLNFCIEHGVRRSDHHRPPRGDERALGSFNLPPFQRPSVWIGEQKVRFIESIWLHLPIASYVVNSDDRHELNYPCDDWLLDGQQRWTAIIDYVNDGLRVFDLYYSELTKPQHRKFMNHTFTAIQTQNLTREQCFDVYKRLAYGGTNHEPVERSVNP